MPIHVTPIPRLTAFAAPALTLGTANAAGSAETTLSTNSTLLAFDTTLPAPVGTAATGSAVVTARRDHVHAGTSQATKTALEAETDQDTYAPPDRIKYSPGVSKGYVRITTAGALGSGSFNVASITDDPSLIRTIVWNVDFANTSYSVVSQNVEDQNRYVINRNLAAGSVDVMSKTVSGSSLVDNATATAAFGEQSG